MFIDTHTHLYLGEFDSDRGEVIQRARENGVERMLLPNIDSSTIEKMLLMAGDYPGICFPMIGLHPGSVKNDFEKELELIQGWLRREKFYAIGEVGMDLYWDKTFLEAQRTVFSLQVNWAAESELPLVIHSREAFSEIFDILEKELKPDQQGVFHSFTGGTEEVEKIRELDFYFGINGIASFKNTDLRESIKHIPLDKLLLETDSPYLAPVPKRGKRNESSFLPHVASAVAGIFGMPLNELRAITTENAIRLFNLK